jgi:hypothetical protein
MQIIFSVICYGERQKGQPDRGRARILTKRSCCPFLGLGMWYNRCVTSVVTSRDKMQV